jgi:glutamine synthetase
MRICIDVDSGLATNVEYKLSDSTANVYLQIAGLLSSGLDGIRRNLQLRPEHSIELSSQSSGELPSTLEESLDMLMHDTCLSQLLGPELLTSYVAVKRADWSRVGDLTQEISDALKRIS